MCSTVRRRETAPVIMFGTCLRARCRATCSSWRSGRLGLRG
ncbi:unnamed protein product [Ectocarpus sp. 12 AP-2014]